MIYGYYVNEAKGHIIQTHSTHLSVVFVSLGSAVKVFELLLWGHHHETPLSTSGF